MVKRSLFCLGRLDRLEDGQGKVEYVLKSRGTRLESKMSEYHEVRGIWLRVGMLEHYMGETGLRRGAMNYGAT